MNYDVLACFVIFQAVFFFLDIYVYTKTNRDIARKGEYTFFGALIAIHMAYLIFNSIWTMQEYEVIHLNNMGMKLLVMGSLCAVTGCAFMFFLFTTEKIQFPLTAKPYAKLICPIPAILSIVLIVLSPVTGWIYSLSEKNLLIHGPLYVVMLLSTSLYLIAVVLIAGYHMFTAKTASRRHSSRALFFSVMMIIIFVILDDLLYKASILPVAIFAVILVIFINMQESNINSDALTGMNNRRKAMDFLTDRLVNVSEEHPLFLYIGDLNSFKSINDIYGHAEGDAALIICSNVLKQAISRYDGFAARYGGDEFLLSWEPDRKASKEEADPEQLIKQIKEALAEQARELKKPYALSMCMGYAVCTDKNEPLGAYIREADAMLYKRKTEFHAKG